MVDEQIFNAYCFVLAFVGFGLLILGAVWLMRERRPPAVASCGFLVALAVCGYATFWMLGLFQFPAAWFFTILRMPSARSVKGVRVSEIVKGAGDHWVTDDYFCGICGDHDNLLAVRLETSSNRFDYLFAYDSRTRVIVPMTIAAAGKFPEFMPDGDELVGVGTLNGTNSAGYMGNNMLELPAKWFRAAVRPEEGLRH